MSASSSTTDSPPVPNLSASTAIKLSSQNYLYWRTQILPLLSCYQVKDHVDGTLQPPDRSTIVDGKSTPNPAYDAWRVADQKAIVLVNTSLTEEALVVIIGLDTARDVWLALERAFCNASNQRVQSLRDSLRVMQKGSQSVMEYGRAFKAVCDQLTAIGHPVVAHDQVHWFLMGLGFEFEGFSTTVRAMDPPPVFSDLLIRTDDHERFMKSLRGTATVSPVAFSAQDQAGRSNRSRASRARGGRSYSRGGYRVTPRKYKTLC
ncbi:hypothetical protein HanRHA438_Chr00c02g0844071 [Helianthus annuus]|nr:hypothetical protein HanRHA438_Chr00c02g0844071 [Helianthus annuus]